MLRRLKLAGLVAAASGLPWGRLVRALADDGHPPAGGPASARLFDLKKVADGIYGAIAKPTAMLNCNAAVIVNRDHVLVVDTHSKPSAAKALIRQIRDEITELPVRYVVDSHLHGDHAMGNEAYPEVFGANVEVISSVKTREWLEKLGVPRLKESLDGLPKQIADFRARLEASKDESERAALRAHIEGLEAYQKEMTPPRVTLPTMTFDRRLVIHRGGREIHLLFLGRAHTAGDVVAFIPSERVIATGDLMHGLLPYMGDGFPDEWPATLRALEALEFDRVIPGHGSIQEGKSVLAQFRGYVEEITEKVARGGRARSDPGRAQEGRSPPAPSPRSRRTTCVAASSVSWGPSSRSRRSPPGCSTAASRAMSGRSSPISRNGKASVKCRRVDGPAATRGSGRAFQATVPAEQAHARRPLRLPHPRPCGGLASGGRKRRRVTGTRSDADERMSAEDRVDGPESGVHHEQPRRCAGLVDDPRPAR